MKQQNFKFIDIVSGLFLLIILAGNYLGLLYITDGNIGISGLLALGLMVYYYFVIDQLKRNKEVMVKTKFKHPSMILWVVFLAMFSVSFLLMSHFINVEFNAKKNIQEEAQQKIAIVNDALNQYNGYFSKDKAKYESDLDALMDSYVNNPNYRYVAKQKLMASPFNVTIQELYALKSSTLDTIKKTYFEAYDIKNSNTHAQINKHIDSSNNVMFNTFLNWSRLNINDKYSQLNFYVKQSINSLNNSISKFAGTYEKIAIPSLDENLPINNPFELKHKYKPSPLVPIIVLILTHAFLLIPFYFQEIRVYSSKSRNNNGESRERKNASSKTPHPFQNGDSSADSSTNTSEKRPKKGVIKL